MLFFHMEGDFYKNMSQGFNHFDENGNAVMVDVSGKNITYRTAVATGEIHVGQAIMEAVQEGSVKKGDVLGVARVAGSMGVKRTSDLIPMCHPLPIQKCAVDYELESEKGIIRVFCTVKTEGKTGVEMEALHAVSAAIRLSKSALTFTSGRLFYEYIFSFGGTCIVCTNPSPSPRVRSVP